MTTKKNTTAKQADKQDAPKAIEPLSQEQLGPKGLHTIALAMLRVLAASGVTMARQAIVAAVNIDGAVMSDPDSTSYLGSPQIDSATGRPKHAKWDRLAWDASYVSWSYPSLQGLGLVRHSKGRNPATNRKVDCFTITPLGIATLAAIDKRVAEAEAQERKEAEERQAAIKAAKEANAS